MEPAFQNYSIPAVDQSVSIGAGANSPGSNSLSSASELAPAAALVLAALIAGFLLGRRQNSQLVRQQLARRAFSPPDGDENEMNLSLRPSDNWDFFATRFCPVCRSEYIPGTTTCEDCGIDLVDENDVPQNDPPIDERLLRISTIGNYLTAQLIRQHLWANRIPCVIIRNSICDFLDSQLFVFESDALRAKKVIRQFMLDNEEIVTS